MTITKLFQPVQGRRSFEDVAAQIRDQISQGNLREGDRLPPERDLASSFGISRNTVREALRALEHAGLLQQKPGVNGGAFIASSGASVIRTALDDLVRLGSIQAEHLTEARLVIQREVVRLACDRYDLNDLAAIDANFEKTVSATESGNLQLRVRHSLEFHRLLASASKNPVLVIITQVLCDITIEFVKAIGVMTNEFVVTSQSLLIEHLRRRDANAAVEEMDRYLRTVLRSYLKPSLSTK